MEDGHVLSLAPPGDSWIAPTRAAQLVCLGRTRVEPVWPAPGFDPLDGPRVGWLLLRIVAAGLPGLAVAPLHPEFRRASIVIRGRSAASRDRLAALLGTSRSPIRIARGVASIDREVLEVDSLRVEEDLEPLLDPFHAPSAEQVVSARNRLGAALAEGSVFLSGVNTDWARAARYRIADAMARAARRLACE